MFNYVTDKLRCPIQNELSQWISLQIRSCFCLSVKSLLCFTMWQRSDGWPSTKENKEHEIGYLLDPMKCPRPQIAPPEAKLTILSSLGTTHKSLLAKMKTKSISKEQRWEKSKHGCVMPNFCLLCTAARRFGVLWALISDKSTFEPVFVSWMLYCSIVEPNP